MESLAKPKRQFAMMFRYICDFFLFKQQIFKILGFISIIAISFAWFFSTRPVLFLENAILYAPEMHVRSPEAERIAHLFLEEGATVRLGETLVAFVSEAERVEQKRLQEAAKQLQSLVDRHRLEVQAATEAYIAARRDVERLKTTIEMAEQALLFLTESQTLANESQKQLEGMKCDLEKMEERLARKTLSSPCNGLIYKKRKFDGDEVSSREILYTIYDMERLGVRAVVPEKDFASVQIGQKVKISPMADPKVVWDGRVAWIAPAALKSGKGVPISIQILSKGDKLLVPNLHATVQVDRLTHAHSRGS